MLSFEERRREGIGGSDIGAILGLNKYKSAYDVYLSKVEGIDPDLSSNEAVIWGNLYEDPIAARYEQVTGKTTLCTGQTAHKDYPFLIANVDRLILGERKGLEIKTVGLRSMSQWGENGSSIIPQSYYAQIAHYMFVLDYPEWDVAAYFPTQEMRIYTFHRSQEMDDIILEKGFLFWKNHVEPKIPPSVDFSDARALEIVKRQYSLVSEEVVEFGSELDKWRNTWIEAKQLVKRYQTLADESQAHILSEMKNAGIGKFQDGSYFTRKLIKGKAYHVAEREYVKLDFKKAKGESNE